MLTNKERYVIGLVIERDGNKALYLHRDPDVANEYKGFWSLPTITVDKNEYMQAIHSKRHSIKLLERLVELNLGGIHLENVDLLNSGTRHRKNYLLQMAIFRAMSRDMPEKRAVKYDDFIFCTPLELIEKNKYKCSTCVSLYFQNLIHRGSLQSTVYYLELTPELADSRRALEEYSPEELWRLAAPNYSLLLKGKAGGDGHFIRELTLDRFFHDFLYKKIRRGSSVLEVGSGDGAILEKILERTKHAYGLELVEDLPVRSTVTKHIIRGNLYDMPETLKSMRFDWIVVNLLLYWLPDLDVACSCISSLLSDRGKVLVIATPPEFTKNGQWEKREKKYTWIMTKPLRRRKELAMINRTVGPLWFYPRSTMDVIRTFGKHRMACIDSQEIYISSFLSREERKSMLNSHPSLLRHEFLPVFTVFVFASF